MQEGRKRACAREALKYARLRLGIRLPVLSAALAVPETAWTNRHSGTDSCRLYWNEDEVLSLFCRDFEGLQRKYLHLLLHGLYLHRFRGEGHPQKAWWLACDLMAEYRIDRMHIPGFEWPIPEARSRHYRKIREEGVWMREKNLEDWLLGLSKEAFQELEAVFRKDEHGFWLLESGQPTDLDSRKLPRAEELARQSDAVHKWRTVLEQTGLRREEHKKQAGGSAGDVCAQVTFEKERGYDYRRFLKRFAASGEELSLDLDSFDYIPYDYSRRMYENLALLEPLEYKDVHKLSEFVIAIDTSGSCSGEAVRRFLTQTWEILQERENFFRDTQIHLIQCDCMVQEHVCVRREEEWKDYLEHMTVKGHGDTDFTPVFRLVDRMARKGELQNLKGLLYFTDGDGIYPSQKPGYETAFVFLNKELRKGHPPGWAIALTLDL